MWSLVIKYINWVDNHPMIIIAKYSSHHSTGMEKMQFNHFLIISLWEFSVAMATKPNQEADWQTFSYFQLPLSI